MTQMNQQVIELETSTIPGDAYALVFNSDKSVDVVIPKDAGGMTDGVLLLMGLSHLLKQPGWAEMVIDATASVILDAQNAAKKPDN